MLISEKWIGFAPTGLKMAGAKQVEPQETRPLRNAAKTAPVVGRTPYDFAAELIQVLGRLTPLFVMMAMFLYTVVEIGRSYQSGRVAATEQYAKSVESLNALISNSFAQLDKARQSQLESLEKITALGTTVSEAITKSQEAVNKARQDLFNAQQKSQEAAFALEQSKREQTELQTANTDLRRQTWIAESTIDVANRLVAFLADDHVRNRNSIRYLSRRYESAEVGGMTRDRDGRTFFGVYRIPGSEIGNFIQFLKRDFLPIAVRLEDVAGQEAAVRGDDNFRAEWLSLSRDPTFAAAQDEYIEKMVYAQFLAQTRRVFTRSNDTVTFDPEKHSTALQAVLWSTAVQNGPNTPVLRRAFDGLDPDNTADAALIKAIYAERRKTELYFPGESELSRKLLAVRYRFEEQEALKMLDAERRP